MKRCSRRPLAASVFFLLFTPAVFGQDAEDTTFPCDAGCQDACLQAACDDAELARLETCADPTNARNDSYDVCNGDLENVRGYVPTVFVLSLEGACEVVREGTTARRLCRPNLAVAAILSQLDIDGDGTPDNALDTDGDGLPDNWEIGGVEARNADGEDIDRVVFYPAPSAIVPGTPPTPVFTRLAVATNALQPDTDNDGLTDFVEVFGLVFIDEPAPERDGILGPEEWNDLNGDGLPSPGEHPIQWVIPDSQVTHDFDGFVFTDPTNPDTDGDSSPDGVDNDPLINPRAFGNIGIIVRLNALGNEDIDQDGLGNGMDMGNDLISSDGPGVQDFEVIDNPESVIELLQLFRQDLLQTDPPTVPESAIEELLGVDWDSNGLWRTTDVRNWSVIIGDPVTGADSEFIPPDDLFDVGGHKLYAPQSFAQLQAIVNDASYQVYAGTDDSSVRSSSGNRQRIGMGWQALLIPSGTTGFLPDRRVWAILYSWRMPGFDIDGDGFVGAPNKSDTFGFGEDDVPVLPALRRNSVTQRVELVGDNPPADADQPFDDRIEIGSTGESTDDVKLDGIIQPPPIFSPCGSGLFSLGAVLLVLLGISSLRLIRRR